MAMPETLKEWKIVITSVGQGYKSMEGCCNNLKLELRLQLRQRLEKE